MRAGGGVPGGGLEGSPGEGRKGRGNPDFDVQKRKNTKEGKARGQDYLWRPWNFAQRPLACWTVPWRGFSSPGARRLGGGPAPSATCAERGLRTQRWGVGGIPEQTASTPTCGPRKLSCPVELMFKRFHMFLEWIFSTAEDFRLEEALPILLQSFAELREDAWEGLAHLATSPIPQLTRIDPTLVAKGLGKMGSYVIPQGLWRELVPESFLRDALHYNVEADPNGGSGSVGPRVAETASTLME